MHLKSGFEREITQHAIRIIQAHVKLPADNVHLPAERLNVQKRPEQHIAKNIDRLAHCICRTVDPEDRAIKRGVGIQIAACGMNLITDLLRGTPLRPVEKQMLKEVRQSAAQPFTFMDTARLAPRL